MGDLASLREAREFLDDLVLSVRNMNPGMADLLKAGSLARSLLHEVEMLAAGAPPELLRSPEAEQRMERLGLADDARRVLIGVNVLNAAALQGTIGAASHLEMLGFGRRLVGALNEVLLPMHQRATAKATLRLVPPPMGLLGGEVPNDETPVEALNAGPAGSSGRDGASASTSAPCLGVSRDAGEDR